MRSRRSLKPTRSCVHAARPRAADCPASHQCRLRHRTPKSTIGALHSVAWPHGAAGAQAASSHITLLLSPSSSTVHALRCYRYHACADAASFHTQVPPLTDVLAAPWCRVLRADVRGLLRIVVWPLQVRIGACCSTRPAAIGRRRRPRGLTRAGWLWHRVLFPKLEELAQQGEYTSVKFIKIDVDELEVRAERPPPAPPLAPPSPNCLRACRLAVPTQNTRQDLAEELDVSSLPTIGLFRNGAEIDRSIGSNIDGVVEMLAKAGAASSKASSSPRASL